MYVNNGYNLKKSKEFGDVFLEYMVAKSQIEGFKRKEKYPVKTITFQVTEDCNLNCSYCYQICKSGSAMTFDTAKKFIDLLIEESYRENSYVYIEDTPAVIIEFIGGEPLLEIDLIDKITEYFKYITIKNKHPWAKSYMISMISNGVLYFKENTQNYLKKNHDRLSFSISLDGCKELHDMCRVFYNGVGSYDVAESACKHYMKNFNPLMSTKLTIAPQNVTWIYKAMVNLYELGYEIINANCIYEEGWSLEHASTLYSEMKKVADFILDKNLEKKVYISLFDENIFSPLPEENNQNYCGTTGSMLALNPDGEIYSCLRFMKSSIGDEKEPYTIGDLKNGIAGKPDYKYRIDNLNSITRRSQSSDECYNCPIAAGCGHCTAYNYQVTGSPNKKLTYICEMHKARSLANVYFWNGLYKKNKIDRIFKNNLPKDECLKIVDAKEYSMLEDISK